MSFGNKKSSTNTTTQNFDNRVVNDASNGGRIAGNGAATAEAGAIVTNVNGSGNTVTDGGAFGIVDKLVTQLGAVASMQTTVARDIALRGTDAGTEYAKAAVAAQAAASSDVTGLTPQARKILLALAVVGVGWAVLKRNK